MTKQHPSSINLEHTLLRILAERGRPIALRELARQLDLGPSERKHLKPLLRALLESGRVLKAHGGRIGLPGSGEYRGGGRGDLLVGRLTCNPAGFGFVVLERAPEVARSAAAPDIYVSAENLKQAQHGDRVAVRVIPGHRSEFGAPIKAGGKAPLTPPRRAPRSAFKGPEGRIVRVLERAQQRLVGRYVDDGKFGGHVVPFDRRVLHELQIPPGEHLGAEEGQMVLAEQVRPPVANRGPVGRVLAVLGLLDDPGVDLKVVMAKYALPDAFPAEVEAEAAQVPQSVRSEDLHYRMDFRPWATVTVDPETARDHDDAISLDRMPGGHWLLGVHIADVAHYVQAGSLLDQEAYLRGTSVYFPDRVVPMLPHALSSNICSLVDGQDRLTQTVVIELDQQGRFVRADFHDGVIRSAARMSYQQVQKIVDGDADLRERFATLVPLFERMDQLAKLMRARRYERGSLDFDLPAPKLLLDAAGAMTGIVATERLDSMRMIEEFMLAANEAVASRLSEANIPALFRIHEQPDPVRVEEFTELCASLGYRVPTKLAEITPQDFQSILRQATGKPEEKLVSYLLLRTMRLARYHEENLGHFGLASPSYAHFTSPIRRYPDLVVHRALRALRSGHREAAGSLAPLSEMGLHLSEMERRASDAERELVEWKKVRFMADKLGEVLTGSITGVQPFGLFVELHDIYVQGLVHVSSLTDDYYQFLEKTHTLRGTNAGRAYRLGDTVKVQLARVDLERRTLDFVLPETQTGIPARRSAPPRRPPKAAPSRPQARTPSRTRRRR